MENIWYRLGARHEINPDLYRIAATLDPTCARAYSAGMIARLFGIDLSMTVTS
jgi:hypothetical protein